MFQGRADHRPLGAPLEAYQAVVSPPDKPLAELSAERDRAWVQLCEEIKNAVNGSPKSTSASTGSAPLLDLGRLPIPGPHFVGRETELARLDAAWEDSSTHVLTLVAFGGVGKSALVARWLDRMAADNWRGAARVLDWSFYSLPGPGGSRYGAAACGAGAGAGGRDRVSAAGTGG